MSGNPGFSCANVSAGTSCCTADNNCGEGLSGGPCYTPPACTYADTACATGSTCPGGTAVSAECADRLNFSENPCACSALQQLAGMSATLSSEAPWNDLANAAYCLDGQTGPWTYLEVECAPVDGVQLPTYVGTRYDPAPSDRDLAGAIPPSLGDLGPSLKELLLAANAITSVPPSLGLLTGLTDLRLSRNALTTVPSEMAMLVNLEVLFLDNNRLSAGELPTEFRSVDPSDVCTLYDNINDGQIDCANVGINTACCDSDNCASTCYQG